MSQQFENTILHKGVMYWGEPDGGGAHGPVLTQGCVSDINVGAGGTGLGVQASKLQHQYEPVYSQAFGAAVITERRAVHLVRGATGSCDRFAANLKQACTGGATITVDLQKNGVSILAAVISFSSADVGSYVTKTAVVTTQPTVVNDLVEVVVTATVGGGTLGQGLAAVPRLREDAD